MAKPQLTFLDYLSEAFHAAPVIRPFGGIPVNKLALAGSALLGFVNPGFWFVGAALEMGYLWMLSTDPRFHTYVQAKRLKIVKTDESDRLGRMAADLDNDSSKRLQALNSNLAEINKLMELHADAASDFMKETKQQSLQQLSLLFLRLLFSKKLINESLQRTDTTKLKREIKELQRQLEQPGVSENLMRSLKGNLEIQDRRLTNIEKAQENLRVVDMELSRIENQVQLIREEVAINRSPEALSSSIDRISTTMSETQEFMSNHSDFFQRMDEVAAVTESPAAAVAPPPTLTQGQ